MPANGILDPQTTNCPSLQLPTSEQLPSTAGTGDPAPVSDVVGEFQFSVRPRIAVIWEEGVAHSQKLHRQKPTILRSAFAVTLENVAANDIVNLILQSPIPGSLLAEPLRFALPNDLNSSAGTRVATIENITSALPPGVYSLRVQVVRDSELIEGENSVYIELQRAKVLYRSGTAVAFEHPPCQPQPYSASPKAVGNSSSDLKNGSVRLPFAVNSPPIVGQLRLKVRSGSQIPFLYPYRTISTRIWLILLACAAGP
jgi:hypothetical protein